jgi:hypothetical protein
MYLTHSFVAIKKGHLDYLFFYLTEDYVEAQTKLREQLTPLLTEFGRNLLDKGAIVKAFDKDISSVGKEVAEKFDQDYTREKIVKYRQPGLLIVNCDFETFNPKKNDWLYISFRDFIEDNGAVKVFSLKELLDTLTTICLSDQNLFEEALDYMQKKSAFNAQEIIELKPGIFGISFDLKEAFKFIRNWRQKSKEHEV